MTIQREFKQLRAAQRICCVLFAPHCLTARVYIIIDGQTNANHRPTRTAQPWHLRLVIVSHVDRCVGLIKVFCTGAIKFNQSTCCMDTQSQRIASARVVSAKQRSKTRSTTAFALRGPPQEGFMATDSCARRFTHAWRTNVEIRKRIAQLKSQDACLNVCQEVLRESCMCRGYALADGDRGRRTIRKTPRQAWPCKNLPG